MLLDNYKKESPIIGVAGMGGGINSYIFLSGDNTVYEIARSLRFNSGDSAYLSTTTPNITTFTYSAWIKRCGSGRDDILVSGSSTGFYLYFHTDGTIKINTNSANVFTSTGQYRDPSAWYNISFSNNGSTFNLYVNGVLDKSVSLSTQLYSGVLTIAKGSVNYADYYLADVHFVDGQALTPTSFGSFDSNAVWQPGTYSGSHGTNGSHLDFKNYGSTANLGKDSAGSNNWTVNNFSVTDGVANDSLLDHPIQESPTDTGKGAEVRGNYCTLNALENNGITLSNGNLDVARSTNSWASSKGTIGVPSGKYYFEYTVNSGSSYQAIGIHKTDVQMPGVSGTGYIHVTSAAWVYQTDGNLGHANSFTNTGVTSSSGDVVMIALDVDAGKVWFGRNGTWFSSGNPATGANPSYSNITGTISPATSIYGTQTGSFNFGQRTFAHAAPSGYKCLNTANLTATIADGRQYFDAKPYSGAPSSVTGLSFSPDFVWLKRRSATADHGLFDIVRGANKLLYSNASNAEETTAGVSAFNSDGFDLGSNGLFKGSGNTFISWNWDGGTSTVTNNNGSIASQVRAQPSAGFSIVSYNSGSSTGNYTLGHGLSSAPKFIIHKSRGGGNWWVYHASAIDNTSKYLQLNSGNGIATNSSPMWGASLPTSSVFGVRVGDLIGTSLDTIAYCFAPVAGYSAMGTATGNGSADGPYIHTGFKVKFLIYKRSDGNSNWLLYDTARNSTNVGLYVLSADNSGGGNTYDAHNANLGIDFLSNGFKIRSSHTEVNTSGASYIYYAVAEHPFKTARAR